MFYENVKSFSKTLCFFLKERILAYFISENERGYFVFDLETEFSIDLPSPTYVSFTIYNVTGQKVRTLVDDYLDAGPHTVTWHGTNDRGETVSSGIYFYRVVAEGNVVTKKMVLMK